MHVNLPEWHVAHELQAHHDHPRDPEEQDVEPGHQHRARIEALQLRRFLRPAQGRERPQGRGKPGVEHVLVPTQRIVVRQLVPLTRLGFVAADEDLAVLAVPGGYPVPPPELAADAPVLDVAHPLEIGRRPVFGNEAHPSVLHRGDGGLGQGCGAYVPLVGHEGLQHGLRAVPPRNGVAVLVDARQRPLLPERFHHRLAGIEAVQADECRRRGVVDAGAGGEHVDCGQAVAPPDFIVGEVVRGRDLDAAGAELRIHRLVRHDGDFPAGQRQAHHPADELPVPFIGGMHGHAGVAQHGLRACRIHFHHAAAVRQRVAQTPQVTVLLAGNHFQVGQRGLQHGVPVNQPLSAVDQALFVQAHENFPDRAAARFVQREAVA